MGVALVNMQAKLGDIAGNKVHDGAQMRLLAPQFVHRLTHQTVENGHQIDRLLPIDGRLRRALRGVPEP